MKKEIFVCDTCGWRSRLDITKQHWCKECTARKGKETEMRPVRVKARPALEISNNGETRSHYNLSSFSRP
jgi:hypothetical protein